MFKTMTLTKAFGALCGSLLILLLGNWAAEGLYSTAPASHNGEEVAQAYSVEVADAGGSDEAAADAGPSFDEVYASADPAAGEKVFAKCRACHHVDDTNATGPHLDGVVGRPVASVADFNYSDALKGVGGDWTPEQLNHWLTSPKAFAPGNKMTFAGLPKIQDRANLISYLASLGG